MPVERAAPDAELLDFDTLRRLPPDSWANLRLRLAPAVEVLRVAWPVHKIWEAGSAFVDWQLSKNIFLNLGHNYQRTNVLINLLVNSDPTLRGDPNRTLGIGGPANPYVGRLYFDGNWNRDIAVRVYRESRVSLSYHFQPKAKWLGTHRLAGMLKRMLPKPGTANCVSPGPLHRGTDLGCCGT
jgi:hypothetical protein